MQLSGSSDVPFAYASARVRMLEQRMLTRADIERMLTAASIRDCLRVLAETEYAAGMGTTKDYEVILAAELRRVYDMVTSFAPEPELLQMWAARHAFLSLKTLLKAALQRTAVAEGGLPLWAPVEQEWLEETVKRALEASAEPDNDHETVEVEIDRAAQAEEEESMLRIYLVEAAEEAVSAYSEYGAPEEIDIAVDACYQRYLVDLTSAPQATFLRGWVQRFADVTNLRTFIRFALAEHAADKLMRSLLVGGSLSPEDLVRTYTEGRDSEGRMEGLSQLLVGTEYAELVAAGRGLYKENGLLYGLEREMEDFLQEHLDSAKHQAFGVGPVWGYLMAKEREVRLIRLILVGKSAGLDEEQLRERISYV